MREIRYRGKRFDTKEWIYGYLASENVILTINCLQVDNDYIGFDDDWSSIIQETVGQYVEILDAYEGDLLYGCETDEYNQICSSWVGEVKFNEDKGRLMIFDKDVDEWFEVDDFMFDKIIGNIHEVSE